MNKNRQILELCESILNPTESVKEVVEEIMDAYIEESVDHFLKTRSRDILNDPRYFYSRSEVEKFFDCFSKKGGDAQKLHLGQVKIDGEFLCYEVCRKAYYYQETPYAKKIMENIGEKVFWS